MKCGKEKGLIWRAKYLLPALHCISSNFMRFGKDCIFANLCQILANVNSVLLEEKVLIMEKNWI